MCSSDLLHHYPYGRLFACEEVPSEAERFLQREVVPTGLLPGQRASLSKGRAGELESALMEEGLDAPGSRRFAWVFP